MPAAGALTAPVRRRKAPVDRALKSSRSCENLDSPHATLRQGRPSRRSTAVCGAPRCSIRVGMRRLLRPARGKMARQLAEARHGYRHPVAKPQAVAPR